MVLLARLTILSQQHNKTIFSALHRRLITGLGNFTGGRLYSERHEWISIDNQTQIGSVGISNHAQEALGDVVFVQVPEVGTTHAQYDEVGAIESVKAASELITPVSGSIIEINDKLESKPSLVNTDCYGDGWLFKIKLNNDKELDKLMDEKQYNSYIEEGKDI